jgi:group I intron endonuclease
MSTSGKIWHIYIITNIVNAKQYVGITNSISKRWNKHRNAKGSAPALHAAINKYGLDSFIFTHIADSFGSESAKDIERMLIKQHNTLSPHGYNLTSGGDGTLEPSEALRKRMSDSHKGVIQSEETRKKRSESLKKAYAEGRHTSNTKKKFTHSAETKKKLSVSKMGNKNPNFGKKQSPEYIAKRMTAMAIAKAKKEMEPT